HIRRLWLRHRGKDEGPRPVCLPEVRQRIDLLIHAVYGWGPPLRVAHIPARPTLLTRLFRRHDVRQSGLAIPATDGHSLWLPMELAIDGQRRELAAELFRTIGLQQAGRALRGSSQHVTAAACPRTLALYTVLEAQAADERLLHELPGMAQALNRLRWWAMSGRPKVDAVPAACRFVEEVVQRILNTDVGQPVEGLPWPVAQEPVESLERAAWLLRQNAGHLPRGAGLPHTHALFKDCWTGDLLPAPAGLDVGPGGDAEVGKQPDEPPSRSAHMPRSPKARDATDDEDKKEEGTWMVQTAEPMEKAEDPMGTQRPTDRDEDTASEEFADALSELPEARLVSSPTPAKEVLLSDDTPDRQSLPRREPVPETTPKIHYPEWDYRINGYHHPGATVHLLAPQHGPEAWVDKTLARHRGMLDTIRRRFEMLQADRVWLRRRLDGDEIDIDAYTEARADMRAGLSLPQALYQQQRRQRRNIA